MSIEIKVSYSIHLIDILDDLLHDLRINNPEYRTAFDVGNNPVVKILASELGHLSTYYALPTERGVTFDIKRLQALREELLSAKVEAIDVANQVIAFEFERLLATDNKIVFTFTEDKYQLSYEDNIWYGSAEHIIGCTMNVTDPLQPKDLWHLITV
ncbi:hypothetical protein [Paenibacillus sp. MMO-58]|uniref:hypothetical protein n=1 Tax=Paenibacillus sp. MMO-58 TaxID=3081290 RepID=UPI00301AD674